MKSFAVLALGAGAAMAQLSSLPQCGQTCINNMISIATAEFGCTTGDVSCYCKDVNFGYGVRDCSVQACSNDADSAKVIAYGYSYCSGALASASTTGGALGPLTSALQTLPSTAIPTGVLTGTGTDAGGLGPAITTSPLVATVTGTDGSTFETTTGFSTVYSSGAGDASSITGSLASAASSVSESLASDASSASESLASAASSVHASLSSAASAGASSGGSHASSDIASGTEAASSVAESATGGGAGASSKAGAAPMMTGLPVAGAAGLAAWLLL